MAMQYYLLSSLDKNRAIDLSKSTAWHKLELNTISGHFLAARSSRLSAAGIASEFEKVMILAEGDTSRSLHMRLLGASKINFLPAPA